MKKLLVILIATVALTTSLSAQKHVPFVSAGPSVGLNNGHYVSIGAEVGTWGVESKTSLSALVSYTPAFKDWYIGIKPYYTVKDSKHYSVMIYACPQYQLTNDKLFVMEEGAGINLNLSKNLLFGLYGGVQHYKENAFQPLASTCLVWLFKK
jgi:hypothetical protein